MIPQTYGKCIAGNNWYNENNSMNKVVVTHCPCVRIWEERDPPEDGKNVIQFYTIRFSIELMRVD